MFKITIRELLLVILSIGLALGWWLDHRAQEWRLSRVYFATAGQLGLCGMGVRLTPDSIQFDDGTGWKESMRLADVMTWSGIQESRSWRDAWREQSNR